MENLAFGMRVSKGTWALIVLVLGGTTSYACGPGPEPEDSDGLGGQGGSGIIVMPPTGGTGSGGTGSGGMPAGDKPPFVTCELPGQGTTPAGSMVLDDFDDGDAVMLGNGLHGNWYQFHDDTGGTHSPSWDDPNGWLPALGGIEEGGYALHVVGGGFTYWGSGEGMSPIWNDELDQECLFDASGFDGVTFWIKGEIDGSLSGAVLEDRGVLKVGFTEADILPVDVGGRCSGENGDCYDWHKVRITPTACWRKHSILFDQLEQDGWGMDGEEFDLAEMVNFNLEIAQGNTYDYWIDEVEFFSGTPPQADEICEDGMGGAGGVGGAGQP